MSVSLWVLFLVVNGSGLWFGARYLWRSRGSPWRDVPRLLATGIVLSLVAAPLALIATQSHFGIARIECHVLFCVLAPLAMARGAWHLVSNRRWAPGALLLLGGLAMDAVYVHARHVEPFDLQIRRYRIATDRLPRSERPLKVIVLPENTPVMPFWALKPKTSSLPTKLPVICTVAPSRLVSSTSFTVTVPSMAVARSFSI